MSDNIERAKGLFSFIKGELKDVIGAFLTGFVLSGAIIGYYSYERTNIFKDRITELSRDITDNEKQIEFLQQTIITSDKDAARWIKENGNKKPVIGFIAGETAPKGRTMGHAGAIVGGADDTAEAKKRIMSECGIYVVDSPAEIGKKVKEVLG